MRIALTAWYSAGPRDVIVRGDDGATVGDISVALRGRLWQAERLAEVIRLPTAGRGGRHSRPAAPGPGGLGGYALGERTATRFRRARDPRAA